MITVHHLNDSRSQRVLWLLEEMGLPYEVKRYQRDARTNLAPPALKAIHPLGKSPVLDDGAAPRGQSLTIEGAGGGDPGPVRILDHGQASGQDLLTQGIAQPA